MCVPINVSVLDQSKFCFRNADKLMRYHVIKMIARNLYTCVKATSIITYELRHKKANVLVSDLVRHRPDCTAKEDG